MKKFYSIISAALIALSLTACNKENGENPAVKTNSDFISESDIEAIEAVKNTYNSEYETVYDAKLTDLDFDGKNEILVLVGKANTKEFNVWNRNNGEINLEQSFGAGKVNYIDKIELKKSEINGEKVYLFSFSYDEGSVMNAERVLSAIKKTADGNNYDVENLLSHGTLFYSDIAEPFTKEFYRKGWSKYDIAMDTDYGDISKEEYDMLYREYTGTQMLD